MNWWTAEYGLIDDLKNPVFLVLACYPSVSESEVSASATRSKKFLLPLIAFYMSYDITEPQPQLFVAPDFKTLTRVLDEMAGQMAFRTGGLKGLNKAFESHSVNTAELNSGIQISGVLIRLLHKDLKWLICASKALHNFVLQIKNFLVMTKNYHAHGFGTPVGFLKSFPRNVRRL